MTTITPIRLQPGPGDCTGALQAALDSPAPRHVLLAPGRHPCRGLRLHGGTVLELAEGAVLDFEPGYDLYAANRVGVIAEDSDRALIVAQDADGIAIRGAGTIRAGGAAYHQGDDGDSGTLLPAGFRPRVLVAERCRDLEITGIAVEDSPMWTLHLAGCDRVRIARLRVRNDRRMPNTDALVLDACRDVTVEDCDLVTADDGIVLKTSAGLDGPLGACARIAVRRCRVESRSCALKLGTESHGDFRDIVFEDCIIAASNRGLGLFSRDGGAMERIRFSRIRVDCRETPHGFWGSGEALTVSVLDRRPGRPAGSVRDVTVEDLSGRQEGAVNLVAGRPGQIEGLRLDRIDLEQLPGRLGTGQCHDQRPGPADLAPEEAAAVAGRKNAWRKDASGRVIGLHPYPGGMPGLYAARIRGLSLGQVAIRRPDPLPAGWSPSPVVLEECEPGEAPQ
ncbi:glycoside hydrolase family 28 protein [Poseidonocella sp. HB161398]|uniref:polygalacturonase PglB n=1 Tax=Poseidonocella sp. HB161398 TaxID=2320855 RepID=UPI001107E475|nr:glycosyl hydrolase family 28 protein [Poseidonocella sp. HB161398]